MSALGDLAAYERASTFVNERVAALHERQGSESVPGGAMVPFEASTVVTFLSGLRAAEHVAVEIGAITETVVREVEAGRPVRGMIDGPLMIMALLGAQLGMRELAASRRAGGDAS
jgi:hypothetical protein